MSNELPHFFAPPTNPHQFDFDIRRRCTNLMKDIMRKVPYDWQLECLVHLAKMHFQRLECGAILVVHATGGGKSAVHDVHVLLHRVSVQRHSSGCRLSYPFFSSSFDGKLVVGTH